MSYKQAAGLHSSVAHAEKRSTIQKNLLAQCQEGLVEKDIQMHEAMLLWDEFQMSLPILAGGGFLYRPLDYFFNPASRPAYF